MREPLTDGQKEVLDFIREYVGRRRMPPSIREINKHFGWSSPNSAYQHLLALEKKGFLESRHSRFWPVEEVERSSVRIFRALPAASDRPSYEPRSSLTREEAYRIELLAHRFLSEHIPEHDGRGPVPIEEAVYRLDYRIETRALSDRVSGQLVFEKRTILINANHSPRRQRFTVAHELAHLVLHIPKIVAQGAEGMDECAGVNRQELEANYLAASVLVPALAVSRFLREEYAPRDRNRIYGDKRRESQLTNRVSAEFNVTAEVALRRLKHLGLISADANPSNRGLRGGG